MSHDDQLRFVSLVREAMPSYFTAQKVLEVGSLDINGSVRQFFEGCDYTGLDVGPGPGVDIVSPGEAYDAPDATFDVVISAECMEHNPQWRQTTLNMMRLLRPGGLLVLSCAAPGRREHGTSRSAPDDSPLTVAVRQDHYRNLGHKDFADLPGFLDGFQVWNDWVNWVTHDYYLIGVKAGGGGTHPGWSGAASSIRGWIRDRSSTVRGLRGRQLALRVGGERSLRRFESLVTRLSLIKRSMKRHILSKRRSRKTG